MNLEQFNDENGEVNEFLLNGKQTVLLIYGTAGSGKSTTAKKIEEFIWKLHGQSKTNQILIPIYISLPSLKDPVYQAVEEALRQDEYGFDELQLKECKEMLEQRKFRFLLIMDSYDEMKLENIQKNLYISNKLYQNWSNPLVIFTTRKEIFSSNNYKEWFAPEDKRNFKEIELQNFNNDQKLEYLTKYTSLSIKMLIFETYEWQIQIQNMGQTDETRFEMTWELLETQVLKSQSANNLQPDLLLNEKQIKSIIQFLKNNVFIDLKSIEATRSLEKNLSRLWSVQKYKNIMEIVNLDKLIETPYMMEIVVQALPMILRKAIDIDNLKQNFIKNFSTKMSEDLKRFYTIQMYEQQRKQLIGQYQEIENQITLNDIHNLEKIDYNLLALQIWKIMEEKQSFGKFSLNQETDKLKEQLKKIFLEKNISNLFLQDIVVQKLQIQNERTIDLIAEALKEQNLTSFDFYAEFIMQHYLKQMEKLKNLGKSINGDRFLHDLQKYSTQLASLMSSKQLTQVQYKQKGLLFKEQVLDDEWLNKFFNDDDLDGSYKKDLRSCTLIQQKGSSFQFVHKSIQEFLIAQDLFSLLEWSKDINSQVFSQTMDILSKKEKTQDCLDFLSSEEIQKYYEAKINLLNYNLFEKQKQLNSSLYNIQKVINFIKTVKNHDFNQFNYSSEIYVETKRFFIKRIQKDLKIIKCLKFLVDLTSVEESLIQSGSNALNLLVEMRVDLSQQSFKNIKIQNTSVEGANFAKCDFSHSQFKNVNINGVNLNGALLINCNWQKLQIDELHQFLGHSNSVLSICFSPDGTTLASGSRDKSIRLWDVKTGTLKYQLDGHSDSFSSVCFSPDGTTLASGSTDDSICLWDVKTGTLRQQLDGHSDSVLSVCFSPDGTTLASGSRDHSIHFWEVKTGTLQQQLDGHSASVLSVSFSPDGTILASGSEDESIRLWDVKTGTLKQQLDGHSYSVQSVCFSPDGNTLASGSGDRSIRLWDVKTGLVIQELDGHSGEVYSICFSPDGMTLASGHKDKWICLWDVKTGTLKQQLGGHRHSVCSVCFSPDGKTLASSSFDNSIRLWDMKTGALKKEKDGHSAFVLSVCFSPDGRTLASGSYGKSICLWDVKTGTLQQQFLGHSNYVNSVCFSPDGTTLASGSKDESIRLWDVKTGTFKQQLDGHSASVLSVSFSPDGTTLASGSEDESIRLWDVITGTMKQQLDGHSGSVYSVCFSPDGKTLASGSNDNSIRLWDVKAGTLKQQLVGHSDSVSSVCFSPDGTTLASGSDDWLIFLWGVKTGTVKQQLNGHRDIVQSVCFSPDGKTLASGCYDKSICLWDMITGTLQQQLHGHSGQVFSVCFSPDGMTLASCSYDKSIRLWSVKTGTLQQEKDGHSTFVLSVCFSPDGTTLATGSSDKSICLWDVKTGTLKQQLDGHSDSVWSVCFSSDGTTLASCSYDKSVRFWDVNTGIFKQQVDGQRNYIQFKSFSPDQVSFLSGSSDKTSQLLQINKNQQFEATINDQTLKFNFNLSQHYQQSTNFSTIVFISPYFQFQANKTLILFGHFENHLGMDLRKLFEQKGCITMNNLL